MILLRRLTLIGLLKIYIQKSEKLNTKKCYAGNLIDPGIAFSFALICVLPLFLRTSRSQLPLG